MQGARCGFDDCDGIYVIGEGVKCRVRDVDSMAMMVSNLQSRSAIDSSKTGAAFDPAAAPHK